MASAEGATNIEVAARLNVSPATVGKWRSRFAAARLAGLADDPRSGRPASVRPDQVDRVVTATLDGTPTPARRWSRASMAAHTGLSASTVGRIWRQFDLRPHLQDGLTLPTDPDFVASVVALVGLYRQPPGQALVLCAAPPGDRPTAGGVADPGRWGRATPDPRRPEQPAPAEETAPDRHRRATAYRRFLVAVDRAAPTDLAVHVVADDPGLHDAPSVRGWFACHPRFHLHLVPAGGSWDDQVHRWSRLLTARDPFATGPPPGGAGRPAPVGTGPPPGGAAWSDAGRGRAGRWISTPGEIRQALARHRERTSGASTPVERQALGSRSTPPTGM